MGSRPFMTLCDLVLTRVLFSTTQKQISPVTFTASDLRRNATNCVELFMQYTHIDTGNINPYPASVENMVSS